MTIQANFPALIRNVTVLIRADTEAEPDEGLYLHLLEATNAVIADTRATGTLIDDDVKFAWEPIPSPQVINTPVPVTIPARYYDGTLASNFNATVSLSALIPSPQVPGMMAGDLTNLARVAARHPMLKLHIDHFGRAGRGRTETDDAAFANLGEILAMAKYPNVAVKMSGAPSYSSYPHREQTESGRHSRIQLGCPCGTGQVDGR